MKLKSLRIRNYRSISEEQIIEFGSGLTVVGPNNSGKTNILGAIRMFFTGFENSRSYSRGRDLTHGKSREQTTLVAVIQMDPERDADHVDKYDRLLALYDPPRTADNNEVVLQLLFSSAGNPSYRLSSDTTSKLPRDQQAAHSKLIHDLVDGIVSQMSVHYVPSSNSSDQLFSELVSPLVRQSVASKLTAEISALEEALAQVSTELTRSVQAVGLDNLTVGLGIPGAKDGSFLAGFDFSLADPTPTAAADKGRGIQAIAMLACFEWLSRQEYEAGLSPIWLIEEPESFLHPYLYSTAQEMLHKIEATGQVVRTTHALTMVPRDVGAIVGTGNGADLNTVLKTYSTLEEAANDLRGSLGVRFSDFFALGAFNVFTEGETDIAFIKWALSGPFAEAEYSHLRSAVFREFGGVKNLGGFLKANYSHLRPETPVVSLFDGDEAGIKALREVKGYLGNHGSGFESNIDYVIGRSGHAVEGLFGDQLLTAMHRENNPWFESWDIDATGQLVDYRIRDQSKSAAAAWLMKNALDDNRESWHEFWKATLDSLETSLSEWRPGRR